MNQMEYQAIQSQHRVLVDKVFANDYYLNLFRPLHAEWSGFELTPKEINSFWSTFWETLPDSRSIHRVPFYEICDMAEGSYLLGEDE